MEFNHYISTRPTSTSGVASNVSRSSYFFSEEAFQNDFRGMATLYARPYDRRQPTSEEAKCPCSVSRQGDVDLQYELGGISLFAIGEYRLTGLSREFLCILVDHRDLSLSAHTARESRAFHWGTQNWGGLILEVSVAGSPAMRAEVDSFVASYRQVSMPMALLVPVLVSPKPLTGTPTHRESSRDGLSLFTPALRCIHCGHKLDKVFLMNRITIGSFPCPRCGEISRVEQRDGVIRVVAL